MPRHFAYALLISFWLFWIGIGVTSAQYAPQYLADTNRAQDYTLYVELKDQNIHQIAYSFRYNTGVRIFFTSRIGKMGKFSTSKNGTSLRDALNQIDETNGLKVVVKEWDIFIVSDVSSKRIAELSNIIKDKNNAQRDDAIDEVLKLDHPEVYPIWFWLMRYGSDQEAHRVGQTLMGSYELLQFSPSFDDLPAGVTRLRNVPNKDYGVSPDLICAKAPRKLFSRFDKQFQESSYGQYGKEQNVAYPQTLDELKPLYLKAPPTPRFGPLCGTGYVHNHNHQDYAYAIGDLRTPESYKFLRNQAEKLLGSKDQNASQKLSEIALALIKANTNDALTVVEMLAKHDSLDKPQSFLTSSAGPTESSPYATLVESLRQTQLPKYNEVIGRFANSSDSAARLSALRFLQGQDTEAFEAKVKSLIQFHHDVWKKENEAAIKQQLQQDECHMAVISSELKLPRIKEFYLRKFEEAEWQRPSGCYLLRSVDELPIEVVLKLKVVYDDGTWSSRDQILTQLIKMDHEPSIKEALEDMKGRFAGLVDHFKSTYDNQLNYSGGTSLLVYLKPSIEELQRRPETARLAIKLLDDNQTPTNRMTGIAMLFSLAPSAYTPENLKQLRQYKDDPNPWVKRTVNSVLTGLKKMGHH